MRNDVRLQSAAHFKPIQLDKIGVGMDGGELNDLVEDLLQARRFGVVKHEAQGGALVQSAKPIAHGGRADPELARQGFDPVIVVHVQAVRVHEISQQKLRH
jgi:hypothetical protein